MRILVTGASGFIGSALVPELEGRGHEVIKGARDPASLARGLAGCDALVHLANLAHAKFSSDLLREVNVEGTRRAAELAASLGVRRFVYLSSIKAIGEQTPAGRPFDGREACRPADAYGATKLAAEQALAAIARVKGLEVVVIRPPLVYGPGVKANFRALMHAVARGWPLPFGSVDNRRSLIYVGNLVDCIARCLESAAARGRTYVVSDGAPVSTPELCRALARAYGRRARVFAFPPALLELIGPFKALTRSLEIDDTALRTELSWRPRYGFAEALRATAQWDSGG